VAAFLAQLGVMFGLFGVTAAACLPTPPWLQRRGRRRAAPVAAAPRRPIQVAAADLRRLVGKLALVPAGAPLLRRHALEAAADAALVEVAELLEVGHELSCALPGLDREVERLRLLAALEDAGLAVRG
jgi:hypothetical protein